MERSPLVPAANPALSSQAASPRSSTEVADATTPATISPTPTTKMTITAGQASVPEYGAGDLDQKSSQKKAKGWKPFTMEAPFLGLMIVLSLGLAGVLEALAQVSSRSGGGLALARSEAEVPRAVRLAYLYLPTTVAVAYGLLWTCVDVDVRRVQPWLALSRPGGARGDQSLLLDYPVDSLLLLPVRAGRRGHWPVMLVALVMMGVSGVITPLQSAIFGKKSVVLDKDIAMSVRTGLVPVEEQASLLDSSILNAAYVSMWFSEELPDYTTNQYAVLPFSPSTPTSLGTNETWRANTTKFATELDCWPANYDWIASGSGGIFRFDNGQGCIYKTSFSLGTSALCAQYMGYYPATYLDWIPMQSDHCGLEFSHQFLAFTAEGMGNNSSNGTFGNITALFCEASYTKQEVSVVVDATTGKPLDNTLVELGPATNLTDALFNATAFEFLLYGGFPMVSAPREYPDDLVLQPEATVSGLNISFPISNMVGFLFGMYNGSISDILDPTSIHETYRAAHQLIFSFAVSQLTSNDVGSESKEGLVQYTLYGIVVSRDISIAVESALSLVAIFAAVLLVLLARSKSNLDGDPDSTASLFTKIQTEQDVLAHFAEKDGLDDASLQNDIAGDLYHLQRASGASPSSLCLLSTHSASAPSGDGAESSGKESKTSTSANHAPKYVRPKELHPAMGILFIAVLAAAIGVLAYLKHQEVALNGLTRPSQNFNVLQILENYIPMAFSTLLELFVILLNRLLAVLQPYYDLQKGDRPAKTTIETRYDSLPPQLNIWRAARAGHYFFALMCVLVLLCNILSIALGAIFNESPVSVATSLNATMLKTPTLTRNKTILAYGVESSSGTYYYFDHFYMVQTNMSNGIQLPPWIDEEFAYFPFSDTTTNDNSSAEYHGVTRGFGVAATCSPLSASNTSTNYVAYDYNGTYHMQDIIQHQQTIKVVYSDANYTCTLGQFGANLEFPTGGSSPSAQELYSYLIAAGGRKDEADFCGTRVLLGWMRYEQGQPAGYQPSASWMECTSELRTARFNVTVDAAGHVLRSEQAGSYENTTEVLGTNTTTVRSVGKSLNQYIGAYGQGDTSSAGAALGWHNDTRTRDWMNYFLTMAATTNGTDLVDPAKALPDDVASLVAPAVQATYQRIGAALLGATTDLFADADAAAQVVPVTIVTADTRIFMDDTAYVLALVILGLYLVAGTVFYARQRETLLPRLPTTIGSTIGFVAASRVVKVYQHHGPAAGGGGTERYGFGRYTGLDGKVHVGIELEPYPVPLRARSSWAGLLMWRRRRGWSGRHSGRTSSESGGGDAAAAKALLKK